MVYKSIQFSYTWLRLAVLCGRVVLFVYKCYIFFIHSLLLRFSGYKFYCCKHCHAMIWCPYLFQEDTRGGKGGLGGISILAFWGMYTLMSIVVVLVAIPSHSAGGFLFPHTSPAVVFIWVLDNSHSFQSKTECQYCFSFGFSSGQRSRTLLLVILGHLDFLREMSLHFPCTRCH